ncbi:S8 family peptidase [Brevibacterium album]|uniref:S8 family peptidase n=1 Tax=Brevibacterium album TaxID=417948 RepID=UPI0004046196|nr:S8 family serine peptidase [Brevibacterium album]
MDEYRQRRERRRRLRSRLLRVAAVVAALGMIAVYVFGGTAGAAPAHSAPAEDGPQPGPGQWFMEDYGIPELWETTRGEGVTVAVVDSGVKADHENLTGKVKASRDFSGSGHDGTVPVGPEEIIHHGTAVAGVIAGNGSGAGPTGVAPEAEIASASVWLGAGGPSAAQSTRVQAQQALEWAVDSGASVVNMSLGWNDPAWPESWDEAFAHAYAEDVVVIACVGNRSQGASQAWSPATVPGVVGVGGLGRSGEVRESSTAPGTAVDLMGPAEDIPVPYHDGGYGTADGCSFAAPVISGIAALLRSAHPEMSADEVVAALTQTAGDVAGHEGRSTAEEPDPIVGWGRVDPGAALAWEPDGSEASAAQQLEDWVRMHRRADAEAEAGAEGPADSPPSASGEADADGEGTATGEDEEPQVRAAAAPAARLGPALLVAGGVVSLGLLTAGGVGFLRIRRSSRRG